MDSLNIWLMGQQTAWQDQMYVCVLRHWDVPSVAVELTIVPWSSGWRMIMEAFKHDALPDVVQVGTTWLAGLVGLGALESLPLAEASRRWGPVDDLDPRLWDIVQHRGRVWAAPWVRDFRLLYYRQDLLGDLPPEDFDTFRRRLRAGDSRITLMLPGFAETSLLHALAPWIWATGADFPDGSAPMGDDWPGFSGLEELFEDIQGGALHRVGAAMGAGELNHHFFGRGVGAACIAAPVTLSDWPETSDWAGAIRVTAIPSGLRTPYSTFVGGSCLGVAKTARDPDLAWHLVDRLVSREALRDLADVVKVWPSRRSAGYPELSPPIDQHTLNQVHARARDQSKSPHWPAYEAILARRLANLVHLAWSGTRFQDTADERSRLVADVNDVMWVEAL